MKGRERGNSAEQTTRARNLKKKKKNEVVWMGGRGKEFHICDRYMLSFKQNQFEIAKRLIVSVQTKVSLCLTFNYNQWNIKIPTRNLG